MPLHYPPPKNMFTCISKALKISVILTIILGLFGTACHNKTSRKIQNIETFARLYGYARWFHPSDEAQEINWDKFAVLGIQKVENIQSNKELRDTLYSLFSPLVQGLQIYETNKPEKFNSDILLSPDTNAKPVAWQHYGVYLNKKSNIYKSARTNKDKVNIVEAGVYKFFTNLSYLQGKEVKLSGYIKSKSQDKRSVKLFIHYWLYSESKIREIFIESQDWEKHELIVKIPQDATGVTYGLWIVGNSEVSVDDFEFMVNNGGRWEIADTVNMGFENGKIDDTQTDEWQKAGKYCTSEVIDKEAHSGKYSLKLIFNYTGKIFEQMPKLGEFIKEPIGNNLTCVIPLTLLANDTSTYPKTEASSLAQLKSEISNIKFGKEFNPKVNLASVIIAWNVLQHFFPYFDVIDTDWNKELKKTLKSTLENKRKKDFFVTLCQMIAQIDDGHGFVFGEHLYHLPIRTELIENKIVITASKNTELLRGDIIKKIDGKSVMKVLHEKEKMISGSPQLRRHRALNILCSKFDSGETHLVIERDGREQKITVQNSSCGGIFFNPIDERPYLSETIVEIEPGIYYINMANCTENIFYQKIDLLANAKAVIYDQRGGNQLHFLQVIPHLIEDSVTSTWWNVPQTIYPNRKEVEFDKSNWDIQPKQPLFKSKTIIINVPAVVSSGETAMGFLDHYNLATTVGEPTAGCNGNINEIHLPCGYQVCFTGMKVLKHDGSQLYIKGFQPNYPVSKTIQAIKEGRDEYLEKALEIANKGGEKAVAARHCAKLSDKQ